MFLMCGTLRVRDLQVFLEEEMGVVGADNLDPSLLSGKTLINVD